MPILVWDKVGTRNYETGLDRGVLYLPDGSAVVWNGLTSVIESFDSERTPVYYEGMKISDLITLGSFSATLKAVTYPDEFIEFENLAMSRPGVFLADQVPQSFGLCYRTRIGNDLDGDASGYKIHILYNVTAIPSAKTYASATSDPSLVEFEWTISAVPEEFPDFRPTAHIILDTRDLDPWLLEDIEEILYGSSSAVASLISMEDLLTFIKDWFRVKIIDNGDGTWTAIANRDGFIQMMTEDLFQIVKINAIYLDEDTYVISDTIDISDTPQIRIDDNGDGTWSASSDHPLLIEMIDEGVFEIKDANAVFINSETYEISDTIGIE